MKIIIEAINPTPNPKISVPIITITKVEVLTLFMVDAAKGYCSLYLESASPCIGTVTSAPSSFSVSK